MPTLNSNFTIRSTSFECGLARGTSIDHPDGRNSPENFPFPTPTTTTIPRRLLVRAIWECLTTRHEEPNSFDNTRLLS